MNTPKFILEPYKGMQSRYTCPRCGQAKTFTRYIDTATRQYISRKVGRCNREDKCGYHYTPKQYFEDHYLKCDPTLTFTPHQPAPPALPSFIPGDLFKKSLQGYDQNNFVLYLISLFDKTTTSELLKRYFIGTSKHWPGSIVFWQIDTSGKVRAGKIMLYDTNTGKRVKEPFNHITWVHSILRIKDFNLEQCFFGEHLLKGNFKPVAIVESEKTAIIASVYLPQFVWLAAGSSTNIKESMFKPLQGRQVVLYPDLNCFEKWRKKADELSHIARISVSELLEKNATDEERKQGLDLADYLINFKVNKSEIESKPEPESRQLTVGEIFDLMKARGYESLPANFFGANAGHWGTQIRCNFN